MADPERGEVWLIDLGYSAKTRPCLVLSTAPRDSERKLATVIPHTTNVSGTRFEVSIPVTFLKNGISMRSSQQPWP